MNLRLNGVIGLLQDDFKKFKTLQFRQPEGKSVQSGFDNISKKSRLYCNFCKVFHGQGRVSKQKWRRTNFNCHSCREPVCKEHAKLTCPQCLTLNEMF